MARAVLTDTNNVVRNIIEYDPESNFDPPSGLTLEILNESDRVGIGYKFVGGDWVPPDPTPPPLPTDEEREASAVRISAQLFAKSMISADTADESTVLVLGPLFPELDLDGASVKIDEVYRHNDEVVVVLQDHTTESHWEDLPVSLYRVYKASSGDGTYPVWEQPESTDPYGLEWDDGSSPVVVQHNGRLYENAHAENVWEPGVSGTESLWIDLGEA